VSGRSASAIADSYVGRHTAQKNDDVTDDVTRRLDSDRGPTLQLQQSAAFEGHQQLTDTNARTYSGKCHQSYQQTRWDVTNAVSLYIALYLAGIFSRRTHRLKLELGDPGRIEKNIHAITEDIPLYPILVGYVPRIKAVLYDNAQYKFTFYFHVHIEILTACFFISYEQDLL